MDEIHKKPKPTSPTALFLYNFVTYVVCLSLLAFLAQYSREIITQTQESYSNSYFYSIWPLTCLIFFTFIQWRFGGRYKLIHFLPLECYQDKSAIGRNRRSRPCLSSNLPGISKRAWRFAGTVSGCPFEPHTLINFLGHYIVSSASSLQENSQTPMPRRAWGWTDQRSLNNSVNSLFTRLQQYQVTVKRLSIHGYTKIFSRAL